MLSWFEVENFKSIKKLHLDFSPFMVFVGPNGAGKTNIVQALALFLDILNAGDTTPIDLYGGYDQLIRREKQPARSMRFALRTEATVEMRDLGLPASLWLQWQVTLRSPTQSTGAYAYRQEFQVEESGRPPMLVRWIDGRIDHVEAGNRLLWRRLGMVQPEKMAGNWPLRLNVFQTYLRKLSPMIRLRLDASALRRDSEVSAPRLNHPLGLAGEGLPLLIERLRPPRKKPDPAFQKALAGLQEVYPRIEDVSTIRFQPGRVALSFKERAIGGELGEGNISDGVMHALALLLSLELRRKQGAPMAIEEPENALHPWALQKIVERAQGIPPDADPILLTTHSPVVVDAVEDPASLFVVESSDKKGTIVTPALTKEKALRAILAQSGQKLGDVWLDGTIGGVPGVEP